MAVEQTLSIIKPDAVRKNLIGAVLARFEQAGLTISALKMLHLTRAQAEGFYAEHKGKPFFASLVDFMTSGPICVQVLEGENAIALNRDRKSTRLNSSHVAISYAVFCLKKKIIK